MRKSMGQHFIKIFFPNKFSPLFLASVALKNIMQSYPILVEMMKGDIVDCRF